MNKLTMLPAVFVVVVTGAACGRDATGTSPRPTLHATQVAVGEGYACAADDRRVFCWGDNQFGRFGNGDTISVRFATAAALGVQSSSLSLGLWHGCAATTEGVVHCWGRNHNGQLGDGTILDQLRPVRIAVTDRLVAVVTGDDFGCGLGSNAPPPAGVAMAGDSWGSEREARCNAGSATTVNRSQLQWWEDVNSRRSQPAAPTRAPSRWMAPPSVGVTR